MVRHTRGWVAVGLLGALALPGSVRAQSADFLFGRPNVTLAARLGWTMPRANGPLFDFVTDSLTLDRGDFAAPSIAAELSVRVRDRLDVTLGFAHAESTAPSEFENWVGTDDLPIEQSTTLRRTPIELGVKGYLKDRGRSVGSLAWVPYGWTPYLGVGAGVMSYAFEQSGEFVIFDTQEIVRDQLLSEGTTFTAHLAGGLEIALGPHLLATGEGRWQWARADVDGDFEAYETIDLSDFQAALGVAVRF